MTDQNNPTKSTAGASSKYLFLCLAFLLVCLGWSGFWYWSYQKTDQLITRLLERRIAGEQVLACSDRSLGGYPFRLVLTCSSFAANNPRTGWLIEGGPVRAMWQIYAPDLALVESDARLTATHKPTGQAFAIASELLRGSIRFSPTDFVARASLEAKRPTLFSNDPFYADLLSDVQAQTLALHLRPTPDREKDLDLSIAATDFSASMVPLVSGQLSLTARDGLDPVIRDQSNPTRVWFEQSGLIENIDGWLAIGQKTLKVGGDVRFDEYGLANGLIKLKILNPSAEAASVKGELSAKRDGLNGPLTAMQLMGKPVKDGDMVGSEVEIKLDQGRIKAGFLTLGTIPSVR